MTGSDPHRPARRLAAVVAVAFGILTLIAGGRVLLGGDPGYLVFRPLVLFNTVMGAVYLAAGILIWQEAASARRVAGGIALANTVVLAGILGLLVGGGPVARESVAAMSFRTAVWAGIWKLLAWDRRGAPA